MLGAAVGSLRQMGRLLLLAFSARYHGDRNFRVPALKRESMNAKRMSKVEAAKIAQGYIRKPVPKVCGSCAYFRSKVQQIQYSEWSTRTYSKHSELRCGIGGFKVGKGATCNRWDQRAQAQEGNPHG